MRIREFVCCLALLSLTAGCASIPSEAPELSAELTGRISAMESAHNRLLEDYFLEKRQRVDEYIEKIWVPEFAREFFNDSTVAAAWNEVVQSQSEADRLDFILIVAPVLQERINQKRLELVQPLEELQAAIAGRLRAEYDQMRAINSTLTALMQSASKLDANRKRYLELASVKDQTIAAFIDEADRAVGDLVQRGGELQAKLQRAQEYQQKIRGIIDKVKE
jgi:phage regulator Rha-like protein